MKSVVRYFAVLGLFMAVLSSCNDWDDADKLRWLAYGVVEAEDAATVGGYISEPFDILLDDGTLLKVVNNTAFTGVKDKDRVYINYRKVEGASAGTGSDGAYPIYLYDLVNILSKEPVKLSYVEEDEEERQEWLGDDPLRVSQMWFGGKYLNVRLAIPYDITLAGNKHFINLLHDDVYEPEDGVVKLYIRHNAYGDLPNPAYPDRYASGRTTVSFDISSLVPEGQESVKIRVYWKQYEGSWFNDPVDMSDEGEFKPSASGRPGTYEPGDDNVNFE